MLAVTHKDTLIHGHLDILTHKDTQIHGHLDIFVHMLVPFSMIITIVTRFCLCYFREKAPN